MAPPAVVEKGVLIRYDIRTSGTALLPRLVVVAGEHSQATIAECCTSGDEVHMLCVPTKELVLEPGARLKMISLQEWGRRAYQVGNEMAWVERDAQVEWISLNFGTHRPGSIDGLTEMAKSAEALSLSWREPREAAKLVVEALECTRR